MTYQTTDIVVWGDAPFDYRILTNRQQVPLALAAGDPTVRVLYVDPPTWVVDRWRGPQYPSRTAGPDAGPVAPRLWRLRTDSVLPTRWAYRGAFSLTSAVVVRQIRRAMAGLGFARPVLWMYGPSGSLVAGRLGEAATCYDVVDDYAVTAHARRQGPRVVDADHRLTADATVVLTTSAAITRARLRLNPHTHELGNAADVRLFGGAVARDVDRPADAPASPYAIYCGSIDEDRVDLDRVSALAERAPAWTFLFVGPCSEGARARLDAIPNATVLGFRTPAELVPLLAHARAGLAPHRDTPHVRSSNSLKTYEYLAAGLPAIVPASASFADAPETAWRASDPAGWVEALARADAAVDDPAFRAAQHASALPHSWERKAERALGIIRDALDGEQP